MGSALLASLQSCTEAFFLGLQVRCLPSVPAASIRCSSRPSQDSDRLQLHTGECGAGSCHPHSSEGLFWTAKVGGRSPGEGRIVRPSCWWETSISQPSDQEDEDEGSFPTQECVQTRPYSPVSARKLQGTQSPQAGLGQAFQGLKEPPPLQSLGPLAAGEREPAWVAQVGWALRCMRPRLKVREVRRVGWGEGTDGSICVGGAQPPSACTHCLRPWLPASPSCSPLYLLFPVFCP